MMLGLLRIRSQAVSSDPVSRDTSNQRRNRSGVSGTACSSRACAGSSAPRSNKVSTRARNIAPSGPAFSGGSASASIKVTISSWMAGKVSTRSARIKAVRVSVGLAAHKVRGRPVTAGDNSPARSGDGLSSEVTVMSGVSADWATGGSLMVCGISTVAGVCTLCDNQSIAESGWVSLSSAQPGPAARAVASGKTHPANTAAQLICMPTPVEA